MKRTILAILGIMTFTHFLCAAQIKKKKKPRERKIVLRRAELETITLYNFEQINVDPVWLREAAVTHFFCKGCEKKIHYSFNCDKNHNFYKQLHKKQCDILNPKPAKKITRASIDILVSYFPEQTLLKEKKESDE